MTELSKKGLVRYALPAILLVSVLLYLPSLDNGYVGWDDGVIRDNPGIRSLSVTSLYQMFIPSSSASLASYQPLRTLAYALVYAVGGARLSWFFLLNVLLHSVNVLLLFVTVRYLTERWGGRWLSGRANQVGLAAALLFALHPTHVEVVSWHQGGKQTLMAAFFLVSFHCYLRFTQEGRPRLYLYSFVSYLAALSTQPGAISLPLVLAAAELILLRRAGGRLAVGGGRAGWLRLLPFFIPALALGYHLLFVSTIRWTSPQEIPLVSRLFTVPALWGHYLVKLLVPVNICCRYPLQAPPSVSLQSGLAWLVFLAVSGWLFFRLAGGGRLGALALVFFAAGLLPTSGLVTTSTLMADRYLYIPALGIFLAAGSGTVRLLDYAGGKFKGAAMPLALAAAIGMAAITLARQRDWRDPVSLWSRVVEVYPGHSLAVFNLAFARAGRGENEKAIELYRRSIALDPSYGDAWANLATLLADRGETSRAVTAVERATALRPDRAEVWLKRGIIYAEAGMDSVALESFTRTVVLDDGLAWKGFYNRAMVLLARGNYRQALADFTEAVRLGAPDFEGSQWLKMASSLQRANLSVQAAGLLERGAQAGTLDAAGWRTLGNLQLIAGRNPQAVQSLLRAAALDSADFRAWTLLGVARHQAGQAAGAVEAYRRALALDTANRPEILNNLGLALQDAGDFPAAERAWLDALELDRNYLEARFNLAAFYINRQQREPAAEQLREVRRLAAGRPQTAEYVEKIQSALDKLDNPTH